MSRIVKALTEAARKMAAGDLSARTRLAGQDEVAELGRALDRLAGSLFTALEELRAERDLHSSILNSMQEGVLVLDRDGRVLLHNRALHDMLNLSDDAVGRPVENVIHHAGLLGALQKSGEAALGEIDLGLPRGKEPADPEAEPGPTRPARLLVRAAPLPRTLPDETAAQLAVFVDVTDLRRLESVRKDFVANASHELRTPVAAIRSAAETLRGALIADPAAVPQFLDIIERNSERLQDLVSDLLDLSRIESRQFALRLEAVEVQPLVEQLLPPFLERADKRGVRLRHTLPPELPPVRADRRALEQVLGNLVDNGVKYVGEGAEVRLWARTERSEVCLMVEDTGPGIEPRHLPRLFERFYRVDAGRSRGLGGTGLGLAIVKHLVEAMEGTVSVESTVGKGTRFTVWLPRAGVTPEGQRKLE
jgi:two-component system phosphate regulon sensor histidine kinase PhoR